MLQLVGTYVSDETQPTVIFPHNWETAVVVAGGDESLELVSQIPHGIIFFDANDVYIPISLDKLGH